MFSQEGKVRVLVKATEACMEKTSQKDNENAKLYMLAIVGRPTCVGIWVSSVGVQRQPAINTRNHTMHNQI